MSMAMPPETLRAVRTATDKRWAELMVDRLPDGYVCAYGCSPENVRLFTKAQASQHYVQAHMDEPEHHRIIAELYDRS